MLEARAGAVATEKLPAQVCASGSGASEITQQLLLAFETVTAGSFSASPIPIRSQSVFVCDLAHSLGCEDTSAQAETGKGPRPAKPKATSMLRIRRIFI